MQHSSRGINASLGTALGNLIHKTDFDVGSFNKRVLAPLGCAVDHSRSEVMVGVVGGLI